jgi:PAS domain S-box-containing protein
MSDLKTELYQIIRNDSSYFDFIHGSLGDGLLFWDLENPDNKWVNDSFWHLLGYERQQVKDPTKAWKNFIRQGDLEKLKSKYLKINKKSETESTIWADEIAYLHKDGYEIHFKLVSKPLFDNEGKAIRLLATLQKIASKEHTHQSLLPENKEQRLKNILFNLGELVFVLDPNFVFQEYYNNQNDEFLFLPPEQFLNKHIRDIHLPDDLLVVFIEAINDAKASGAKSNLEYSMLINGKEEIFIANVLAMKNGDGQVLEIIISSRRITDLKSAESKLKELALVASKTNDLAVITDGFGRITWVNKAFENQTGYRLKNIFENRLPAFLYGPETTEKAKNTLEEAIKNRQSANVTLIIYKKDQKKFWVEIQIDPVFNEAGLCSHFILVGRDITQRKEWENELARTKELLLETNRVAKIGGWSFDAATNTVYWSEVTREIHEVGPDFVPTVEKVIDFYKDGGSRLKYFEAGMNAVQKGIPYDLELQITTAKGREIWVRTIGKVEFKDGVLKRLYGTFQNIDSFKEAEQKILDSSNLLKHLSDQIPGALYQYVLNDDGIHTLPYVSEGILAISGKTHLEMEKDPNLIFNMIHPDDLPIVNEAISKSYKTLEQWKCDFRIVAENGEIKWLRGASTPQRKENGVVWHGFLNDITSYKLAEESLKKSEAIYRSLYQHTSDAVMLLDEKGFFDCNPATLQIFGCSTKEQFCAIHPADVSPEKQSNGQNSMELANQQIQKAFGEGSNDFEWTHKRLDSQENFEAHILLTAMELDGRKFLHAVVREIPKGKHPES